MGWILSLLTILVIWTAAIPTGFAQEATTPPITEEQLQQGETIAKKAIEATEKGDFAQAETYWTQLVDQFPSNPAVWSNRGNARVSQNKLKEAIADFNRSIELAPDAPDPYLNRGTALEGQGQYLAAIADYNRVLELNPDDPMAYNNRGNAEGGQGDWTQALIDYQKAAEIAPNFAFARANAALASYQLGKTGEAITEMRNLVRKYPMFPDMRAALTAVLWNMGQQGEAESHWVATMGMDNRYQDLDWVKNIRRWPPQMVAALDKFLNLK
ncbi:tetratricopeptide repeat protein [Crocosphaera sp. XPORK-15E]|uniref:tetratricopeptide repeat protein n=1 Tax=Crocosphaera sp. XPORK-15E TaxID=3110247 RepID=UPI002B1F89F7|nr:tetratricopeptide repeat protein [Crocosphaera sp. XPORK-15E]MEA5534178.1 tetratricopeptide repeat protein [Crocosphaera sp. XPORK-15E]